MPVVTQKYVENLLSSQAAGLMNQTDVERFAAGIELKDSHLSASSAQDFRAGRGKKRLLVEITLAEGKFHQVKRMVPPAERKSRIFSA